MLTILLQVVDILTRALMLPDTPVTTKIARLYLLSDILHNSSVPVSNAWKYRSGYVNWMYYHRHFAHYGIESDLAYF